MIPNSIRQFHDFVELSRLIFSAGFTDTAAAMWIMNEIYKPYRLRSSILAENWLNGKCFSGERVIAIHNKRVELTGLI